MMIQCIIFNVHVQVFNVNDKERTLCSALLCIEMKLNMCSNLVFFQWRLIQIVAVATTESVMPWQAILTWLTVALVCR